ncbi:uncharacterized protein EI90DRAFT_3127330 [Cantharellus anzutake]|uniref:uncharacterized protein n=1 Tax=Cantharellus anzutake TaxID=1750568 RepID=UPI001907CC82|nr:uncharacterized protein EI90DRAFT_3127330 [Cantharellus anzutake]KAF8327275.1 hypothetical protein EI90DRAFT_3127330 [Cantharellus anzutake]
MSTAEYSRLPTYDPDRVNVEEDEENRPRSYRDDPRFVEPTPAHWKRAALILFILFLAWAGYKLRSMRSDPVYVYADRYSQQFKYRPAASPIIRRRLPDGRIEIRGDYPRRHPPREEL